ncbi:hypothetical protein DAI22_02g331650 [Oryza sativa Japonica Group]|jgi:hypothetical protein|nr:hypothetical protein DAI22_02g331650 [Oryza sativa Japonica Group]
MRQLSRAVRKKKLDLKFQTSANPPRLVAPFVGFLFGLSFAPLPALRYSSYSRILKPSPVVELMQGLFGLYSMTRISMSCTTSAVILGLAISLITLS